MNSVKKLICIFVAAGATSGAVFADQIWLVTPEEAVEYQGEKGYVNFVDIRPKGLAPTINLVQPDLAKSSNLKAPISIEVTFVPLPDSPIDPGSFKVLYGALRFDVTSKILQKIKVTEKGFSINDVSIPEGKHSLVLRVEDMAHRPTEKSVRFEVE